MALSEEKLVELIEKGDVEGVHSFFDGAAEKERRALAKVAKQQLRHQRELSTRPPYGIPPGLNAARAALSHCGTAHEVRRAAELDWDVSDETLDLLAQRPFALTNRLANILTEETPGNIRVVLKMMRRGLCERPSHDNYLRGFMVHSKFWGEENQTLIEKLRDNLEFLKDDLWRILTFESGFWHILVDRDFSENANSWSKSLSLLSDEGLISRNRMLDASLDFLSRGYSQNQTHWHKKFHEFLKPTLDERKSREEAYLRLLASNSPQTVTFALKALAKLEKAKKLDVSKFLQQAEPALQAKTKAAASQGIRVLSAVAKAKGHEAECARAAVAAFHHKNPDIHGQAMDLIEKLKVGDDDGLRALLRESIDFVAPSIRSRIEALIGEALVEEVDEEEEVAEEVAVEFEAEALPTAAPREVRPVSDLNDLVLRFLHVLSNRDDVEEIEQVLGGFSLLHAERPDNWEEIVSPLRKRVEQITESRSYWWRQWLVELALMWTKRLRYNWPDEEISRHWRNKRTYGLYHDRCADLFERGIKFDPLPLPSLPTAPRGFIDPSTLVERVRIWQEAGREIPAPEAILSLLRLANIGREGALKQAASLTGEYAEALRYALGSDDIEVGPTHYLWIAAARARDPVGQHPLLLEKHKDLGPDGVEPATIRMTVEPAVINWDFDWYRVKLHRTPSFPIDTTALYPTVLFHWGTESALNAEACGTDVSMVKWSALIHPGHLEGYFSVAVERIDIEWTRVQWEVRHFFDPMLEPDVELGPMAHLLIALGLAAKEPGQRGLAIDVVITACEDGRLDVSKLGEWMGELIPTGMIKGRRWANTLTQIAQAGKKPAAVARALFQACLRGDPSEPPRDIAYLLEAMYELFLDARESVSDPAARAYLEGLTKGGKAAKLKKQLLALSFRPRILVGYSESDPTSTKT